MTIALTDLARLARREGDLPAARERCREALALGEIGSQRAVVRLLEELAGVAAVSREPGRALRLQAAASSLRAALGWPAPLTERQHVQRLIDDQRAALGAAASEAWSQGWQMTPEDALRCAADGA